MKTYQKAELIAKNLPTGSYAAGCPVDASPLGGGEWSSPGYNVYSDTGIGHTSHKDIACRCCMRAE